MADSSRVVKVRTRCVSFRRQSFCIPRLPGNVSLTTKPAASNCRMCLTAIVGVIPTACAREWILLGPSASRLRIWSRVGDARLLNIG